MDLLPPVEGLAAIPGSLLASLRERFRISGFTPASLLVAESIAPLLPDALRLPVVRWHLCRHDTPAARMARLFLYGDELPSETVTALLGEEVSRALLDAQVLVPSLVDEGRVRC